MKIIQIGQFPLNPSCIQGGVEASVFGLALEQAKTHEVTVFDFPRFGLSDSIEEIGGIKVFRFGREGSRNISALRRVRNVAERVIQEEADVCHIHGTSIFSYMVLRAISGQKTIVTVHGVAREEKKKALQRKYSTKALLQLLYQSYFEKLILKLAPVVIADTEYVNRKIRSLNIHKYPTIHVIPQGIEPSFFYLKNSADLKFPILLSVGSFTERKGHLLLLRAFDIVWNKLKNVKLIIAGTNSNSKYYESMRELTEELPCRENITFLPDIPKARLMTLYESASIFALHSEEESQGIVFAEAMASGLPIVATNVGGVSSVVENGKNGLLSEYGDILSFANNIIYYLENCKEASEVREHNRIAAHKYDWSLIAETVNNVYLTL